jgi:hypothetical protein
MTTTAAVIGLSVTVTITATVLEQNSCSKVSNNSSSSIGNDI